MTTLGTGHCFRATDFACSIFDVQVGHVMINFLHRCILNLVRIASVAGKGQRPAIAISDSFDVYVGNDGTSALTLDASELFGFNVGAFDYKVVRNVDAQTSAIPWRLQMTSAWSQWKASCILCVSSSTIVLRKRGLLRLGSKITRWQASITHVYLCKNQYFAPVDAIIVAKLLSKDFRLA